MKKVVIHTDGGCEGNPGVGGWAAVLRHDMRAREISGSALATTNNRMELQAALEGLRALKEPCEVELFTDSKYLQRGIGEWIAQWKARGWRTATRKPVKNEDLWRALDEARQPHVIAWKWLKGHVGHADNERCDVLANLAIAELKRRHSAEAIRTALEEFQSERSSPEATLF